MSRVFLNLNGVIADRNGVTRPGIENFINKLRDKYSVYVWSDNGVEYTKRMYEKLGLPEVDGFHIKGKAEVSVDDYVIDCSPSFMKSYPGACIQEFNSEEIDPRLIALA